MKPCKQCGRMLPLDEFYRAAGMRDGLRSECKACNLAAKKRWYEANREHVIAKVKAWQQANAERVNESHRRRRARPEVKAPSGRCAICRRKPTTGVSLDVDHEHRSRRVRGLLCSRCNHALRDFGDRPDLLVNALHYLTPPPTAATRRRIDALATR